jgi:hypothetical protein
MVDDNPGLPCLPLERAWLVLALIGDGSLVYADVLINSLPDTWSL